MKKATLVFHFKNRIDDYLSLIFYLSSSKHKTNIILLDVKKEDVIFIQSLVMTFKRDNVELYLDNYKDSKIDNYLLGINIHYTIDETAFGDAIILFADLNVLTPYVDYINNNNIKVIYGSLLPYIDEQKPLSELPLDKNQINKVSNEIPLSLFKNITIIPYNVSSRLQMLDEHEEILQKSNNICSKLVTSICNKKPNNKSLFYLSLPLFLYFQDNFAITPTRIKRVNSHYTKDKDAPLVDLVTHVHKVETMVKIVFENFSENKQVNSEIISLNIPKRYILNRFLSSSLHGLRVEEVGWEKRLPSSSFGPNKRKYYILHFVTDGKGKYQIGTHFYSFEKGDCFLVTPDAFSYYEADEENPCEYYWIAFSGQNATALLKETPFSKKTTFCYKPKMFMSMLEKIRYLVDLDINTPNYDLLCLGNLYFIFANLIHQTKETIKHRDIAVLAKEYIDANYMNQISVTAVAKYLNYDRTYIFRKFKEKFGVSLVDYLLDLRLKKAQKLIEDNIAIQTVSSMVGFADYQSFFVSFKKKYGISPTQYKKQH